MVICENRPLNGCLPVSVSKHWRDAVSDKRVELIGGRQCFHSSFSEIPRSYHRNPKIVQKKTQGTQNEKKTITVIADVTSCSSSKNISVSRGANEWPVAANANLQRFVIQCL